jgi:hypothetical protein
LPCDSTEPSVSSHSPNAGPPFVGLDGAAVHVPPGGAVVPPPLLDPEPELDDELEPELLELLELDPELELLELELELLEPELDVEPPLEVEPLELLELDDELPLDEVLFASGAPASVEPPLEPVEATTGCHVVPVMFAQNPNEVDAPG